MPLARAKARAVAQRGWTAGGIAAAHVVLGADTEVLLDGRALGKPADAATAVRMLRALRGRTHEVITGLALVEVGGRAGGDGLRDHARPDGRATARRTIEAYVATGEPFDKAGGYAVQGEGGRLVADVDGCSATSSACPWRRRDGF